MELAILTAILTIINLLFAMYQHHKQDTEWQYSAFWALFMLICTTINMQN